MSFATRCAERENLGRQFSEAGSPQMPDFMPITEVWENPSGYSPQPVHSGGVPPVAKLGEHLVVDWWATEASKGKLSDEHEAWIGGRGDYPGPFAVRVWKSEDNPNIGEIPDDAPRAVRNLYKASTQLSILRMSDTSRSPIDSAMEAWERFAVEKYARSNP